MRTCAGQRCYGRERCTKDPGLVDIHAVAAGGNIGAVGALFLQKRNIVWLEPCHGRGRLLKAGLATRLPCGANELSRAAVDFCAFVNLTLLCRAIIGHPVHVLWSAKGFGPGSAQLQSRELLAGRR